MGIILSSAALVALAGLILARMACANRTISAIWSALECRHRRAGATDQASVGPRRIVGRVFNPYASLDLPANARQEEIEQRYQELLARYHPSKVAQLPEVLQRLAHERTVEVQKAYQMLCGFEFDERA